MSELNWMLSSAYHPLAHSDNVLAPVAARVVNNTPVRL